MITTASVDALITLLQAQRSSILAFLDASYPYLDRAAGEVRRPLREMIAANTAQVQELGEMIELQRVVPPPIVDMEDQYLAFLSIEYVLPKLLEDRREILQAYQTALAACRTAPGEVTALLLAHLAQLRLDVATLEKLVRTTV